MSLRRIAALASLAFFLAGSAMAQSDRFFRADPAARAQLGAQQAEVLGNLEALDPFVSAVLGRVDAASLRGDGAITVELAGGSLTLRPDRVERRAAAGLSWFGSGDERGTMGTFVVQGGVVVGTLRHAGRLYALRPLGGGLHALVRLDEDAFRDHPPEWDAVETAPAPDRERSVAPRRGSDPTITLIVPYTANAVSDVGGVAAVEALVQLAEDETNQSYLNSNVGASVEIVYTYQTDDDETGSLSTDKDRFRIDGDGYFDEVHDLRDDYAADVAIMITGNEYSFFCGSASDIYATEATAFAIATNSCATGYYTFGHELGHLQGARHNPEADGSSFPFPYGHGKYYSPADWRTVMSYNCPGGCTRIPYWSNPDVFYGGVPMGDVSLRHNQRVLTETAAYVASFREDAGGPVTLTATPTGPVVLARGEQLHYDVTLEVSADGPSEMEYRAEADLPNGTTFGPLLGPGQLLVSPPQTVTASFSQLVPNGAPFGDYTYRLVVTEPSGDVLASDSFEATVTPALATSPPAEEVPDEWLAYDGEGQPLAPGTTIDLRGASQPVAASRTASPAVQAYPNPFARQTTLSFALDAATDARLAVYDVRGREVAVLVDGPLTAGRHTALFDGAELPSGVYLWRLVAAGGVETGRVTLLR